MADVGVYHNSILSGGGAETVAVTAIEGLVDDGHNVSLYTTDDATARTLAEYYAIDIDPESLEVINPSQRLNSIVDAAVEVITRATDVQDLLLLRNALMEIPVRYKYVDNHDVFLSTQGEFFHDGVIHYIHFPYYSADAMRAYTNRFDDPIYSSYHWFCRLVKKLFRAWWSQSGRVLTNSRWTSKVIQEVYETKAGVVYPPVPVEQFDPPAWSEKEAGFVTIGRIHPTKRQKKLIGIMDAIVERGHDTHLHIVGDGGDGSYYDRVQQLAAERNYIHLEGRVSRAKLVSLIENHRFGIHGKHHEHFGIVVAEMLAGGIVPLVPRGGGQTEVVDGREQLVYDDEAGAVEKATSLFENNINQQKLFEPNPAQRFRKERFANRIVEVVSDANTQPRS